MARTLEKNKMFHENKEETLIHTAKAKKEYILELNARIKDRETHLEQKKLEIVDRTKVKEADEENIQLTVKYVLI